MPMEAALPRPWAGRQDNIVQPQARTHWYTLQAAEEAPDNLQLSRGQLSGGGKICRKGTGLSAALTAGSISVQG